MKGRYLWSQRSIFDFHCRRRSNPKCLGVGVAKIKEQSSRYMCHKSAVNELVHKLII